VRVPGLGLVALGLKILDFVRTTQLERNEMVDLAFSRSVRDDSIHGIDLGLELAGDVAGGLGVARRAHRSSVRCHDGTRGKSRVTATSVKEQFTPSPDR
jgi:hypothetical protein